MGIVLVSMILMVSAIAMWSEVLKANIIVQSGNVDIDVASHSVVEGNEFGKGWVADCSVNIVDNDESDTVEINIVIDNGYPGYNCTVYFTIQNTGTIPVIGPFYDEVVVPEGLSLVYGPVDYVRQLHPGDTLEHRVSVEVLQSAQESTEYNVIIEVEYIQWNEVSVEVKSTSISGCVFNDLDGDGVWDQGEPTLQNILIELLEDSNLITSTYTDEDGCYSFVVYPRGAKTYTIKAYAPPGYEFTTPDTITLTVQPEGIYPDKNFGMRRIEEVEVRISVAKDFRETNVNFKKCPAELGTPLEMNNSYYIVKVEVPDTGGNKGKVVAISPGALYGVIAIEGQGIKSIYVEDRYDYQFNVEDGEDGRVRVYILDKVTGCVTELKSGKNFTYTVDNKNNVANISISLSRSLKDSEAVLVYLKFKPTEYHPVKEPNGLKWHPWDTLDRYFENTVKVTTNIGSAETITAVIRIDKK